MFHSHHSNVTLVWVVGHACHLVVTFMPTTCLLIAEDESTTRSLRSSNSLIRFPQPSEDPADPLNWAQWRKFGLLLTVSLYSFVGNFTSSGIAPALSLWFKEFPHDVRPFSDLSYFIAVRYPHHPLMPGARMV